YDVAGAGLVSLAGRARPRLPRLSAASGGTALGRACRASFRRTGPDAVSAREPGQARRPRAASAAGGTARRTPLVAAAAGCRSFLPRAGARGTQGRRRQKGHDGCACRLDPVGDLLSVISWRG